MAVEFIPEAQGEITAEEFRLLVSAATTKHEGAEDLICKVRALLDRYDQYIANHRDAHAKEVVQQVLTYPDNARKQEAVKRNLVDDEDPKDNDGMIGSANFEAEYDPFER